MTGRRDWAAILVSAPSGQTTDLRTLNPPTPPCVTADTYDESVDQLELFVIAPDSERQSADALVFRYGEDLNDPISTTVVAVDSGRRASTGAEIQNIVTEFFNLSRIDLIISSHADEDHAGGIPHLLNNLDVGKVWIHRPQNHRPSGTEQPATASVNHVRDILVTADHHGIPTVEPFSDMTDHEFAGLHILGPSREFYRTLMERGMYSDEELDALDAPDEERAAAGVIASASTDLPMDTPVSALLPNPSTSLRNSSSTIVLLALETKQLLLTSDAGVEAFESARTRFTECGYEAANAIVQLPHHGSRNSLNPSTADLLLGDLATEHRTFVTAAIDDRYGFPHVEVTDEFIRRGRRIPSPRKGGNLRYAHKCPLPKPPGYSAIAEERYIRPSWDEPLTEGDSDA